jgi:predicted metal-binding protein
MTDGTDWETRAVALGADGACTIPAASVETAAWVTLKCRYGCEDYGSSRTCPPHAPSLVEFRAVLACYGEALLVYVDSRKEKGAKAAGGDEAVELALRMRLHRVVLALERELFLTSHYKAFGLAEGPCHLCVGCDLEAPCVHPADVRPSMQACGIDTFATVRAAGLTIEIVPAGGADFKFYGLVLVT